MSTLALYRSLIPAHGGVLNDTVAAHLSLAASALDSAAFGGRFAEACVYLAAHRIERTPGSGANGSSAEEAGAVTAQSADFSEGAGGKSSRLSRSYAIPGGGDLEEQDLRTTRYGQLFLASRTSRAARAPTALPSLSSRWPYRRCS